jgi:CHAD domain-containing protein
MGDLLQELEFRALDLATAGLDRIDRREFGPKSVHAIRVGGKRLRALWQLLVPSIPKDLAQGADTRLRDANRMLARTRDAHVARSLLEKLIARCTSAADVDTLQAFLAALPEEAEAHRPPSVTALSETYRREIGAWHALRVDVSDDTAIRAGILRSYRKGRGRGREAVESGGPLAHHRWRRWVKYLLHQLQALEDRLLDWQRADIEKLDRLADDLGKFNDIHNLLLVLPSLCLDAEIHARADRILAAQADALRQRCRHLYAELYRAEPDAYASSIAEAATASEPLDVDLAIAD